MLRRAIGVWLGSIVLTAQLFFAAELLFDLALPALAGALMLTVLLPGALTFGALRRSAPASAPARWGRWLLFGVLFFAVWGGLYFLVGSITTRMGPIYWDEPLLERIPFRESFVLLYFSAYPFVLLPFAVLQVPDETRRLLCGGLFVLAASVAMWSVYPLAIEPPPPPGDDRLTSFILRRIQDSDVPTNGLPSTHAALSVLVAGFLSRRGRGIGAWAVSSAGLIVASTVVLRQHYVPDALVGAALGFIAFRWSRRLQFERRAPSEG